MERGARREIDRLTGEGLAEGYRLAHEARAAIRSRYEDWMVVIAIAGLLGWGAILLATVLGGTMLPGAWTLVLSVVVIVAACTPAFMFCRRHFAALMAEQDRWMARLSGPRHDDDVSTFDLLMEVSEQVPVWLTIKQRNRFGGHPFLTTAIFISGTAVAYISLQSWVHHSDSSFPYLVLMLLPFLALLIASFMAERTAVRREREAILARWRERTESSRQAMEELLGGI